MGKPRENERLASEVAINLDTSAWALAAPGIKTSACTSRWAAEMLNTILCAFGLPTNASRWFLKITSKSGSLQSA